MSGAWPLTHVHTHTSHNISYAHHIHTTEVWQAGTGQKMSNVFRAIRLQADILTPMRDKLCAPSTLDEILRLGHNTTIHKNAIITVIMMAKCINDEIKCIMRSAFGKCLRGATQAVTGERWFPICYDVLCDVQGLSDSL